MTASRRSSADVITSVWIVCADTKVFTAAQIIKTVHHYRHVARSILLKISNSHSVIHTPLMSFRVQFPFLKMIVLVISKSTAHSLRATFEIFCFARSFWSEMLNWFVRLLRCLALHVSHKPRRKKGKSFVSGRLTFLCATLKACLMKSSFTAAVVGVRLVLVQLWGTCEWHDVSTKRWKWEAVLIKRHWMGLGPVCQVWNDCAP